MKVYQSKLCCLCVRQSSRIWLLSLDTSQIKGRDKEGAKKKNQLAQHSAERRLQGALSFHKVILDKFHPPK